MCDCHGNMLFEYALKKQKLRLFLPSKQQAALAVTLLSPFKTQWFLTVIQPDSKKHISALWTQTMNDILIFIFRQSHLQASMTHCVSLEALLRGEVHKDDC